MAKGLTGRVHLNCETPASSWSISCKKDDFLQVVLFRCRLRFLLLVFVELTNVNIVLSSGREFMLLFLVYCI